MLKKNIYDLGKMGCFEALKVEAISPSMLKEEKGGDK